MASSDNNATIDKIARPCENCGKPCKTRCSQCKTMDFCSRECQKDLWKTHKAFCHGIAHPTLAISEEACLAAADACSQKCLVVDGLAPGGAGCDDMTRARAQLLKCGIDVAVVDVTKCKGYFVRQLASLLHMQPPQRDECPFYPTAILVLGWGSGGIPQEWNENKDFQDAIQQWVRNEGNFLVQGERVRMCDDWPTSWFDKPWKDGDFLRTDHKCFAAGPDATHWASDWFQERYVNVGNDEESKKNRLNYNVHACMLKDVPPHETLYGSMDDDASHFVVPEMAGVPIGSGSVAVAYGKYGQGTVSFFGDVNYEEQTLELMAVIAKGNR